jgi:cell division protein ZapD
VNKAVAQVLKLLREASAPRRVSVEDGLYQQQLDPALQCQLIRLFLNDALDVFPEISGGKHRFVVRFFRQPDTTGRPEQVRESMSFELQCCGI